MFSFCCSFKAHVEYSHPHHAEVEHVEHKHEEKPKSVVDYKLHHEHKPAPHVEHEPHVEHKPILVHKPHIELEKHEPEPHSEPHFDHRPHFEHKPIQSWEPVPHKEEKHAPILPLTPYTPRYYKHEEEPHYHPRDYRRHY
jgi:hypothetical protein